MKTSNAGSLKVWAMSLLAVTTLLLPMGAQAQNQSVTYYEADAAFNAWNSAFLVQSNGKAYYTHAFNDTSPAYGWGQALDICVVEDVYQRTHSPATLKLLNTLLTTFLANNGTTWNDGWNDDTEWNCIACIRGYRLTGNTQLLNVVANNWNATYSRGWDNVDGGGIWENNDKYSKCALSNDPFVISGCYLYAATGNITYLNESEAAYNWVRTHIVNTTNATNSLGTPGQVNEALTNTGALQFSDNAYNAGSFIEAANLLHQLTGNPLYYNDAIRTINHFVNEGPTLHSNAEDTGSSWAYWFMRGLSDVCTDNNLWGQYYPWMLGNANAAWSHRNSLNVTWNDWTNPTNDSNPNAVECSSAVALWQALDVPPQYLVVNDYSGLAMDLIDGNPANNAPVNQTTLGAGPTPTQHWIVFAAPGGHDAIVSAYAGTGAAPSAASRSNDAPLLDWPYSTGDTSMQYNLVAEGGGLYQIQNVNSGLALDDAGFGKDSGSQITQWRYVGSLNQLWKIAPFTSFAGNYELQNVSSSLAVTVSGGSQSNGATAVQQPYAGSSASQIFTFVPTNNGYYQIRNVASGLDLNVAGGSALNGAGIVQWSFGPSGNDQWLPVQNTDGTWTFYNLNSGLVLEDPGFSNAPNTQFDQWLSNSGSNQKFNLIAH